MSTFGFDTEEKVCLPGRSSTGVGHRPHGRQADGVTKIKLYLLHTAGGTALGRWVPESPTSTTRRPACKGRVKEFQRAHKKKRRAMPRGGRRARRAAGKRKLGDGAPSADEGLGEIREQRGCRRR